jgi:hypothetical protein
VNRVWHDILHNELAAIGEQSWQIVAFLDARDRLAVHVHLPRYL